MPADSAPLELSPLPGGRWRRYRLALKMAWRDIRKHRGRSILIMLLIMLPVFGLSAAATFGESAVPTQAEAVSMLLGKAQAKFTKTSMKPPYQQQSPLDDREFSMPSSIRNNANPVDVRGAIPSGYRAVSWRERFLDVAGLAPDKQTRVIESEVLDPVFEGKYTLGSGRPPEAPAEVLASPGLLQAAKVQLGGVISTEIGQFTVVGTILDSNVETREFALYLRPGELPPLLPGVSAADEAAYFVDGDQPVTWAQIKELNRSGVVVLSRAVLENPPDGERWSYFGGSNQEGAYYLGGLIGTLALLEVGLLAGAAFAVGAKGRQRELALLAATGAEIQTLRSMVTAGAVWLGLAAGVLGAGGGMAAALLAVGYFRSIGRGSFAGLHPNYWVAGTVIVVAVLAAYAAALLPARAVARQATMAALRGGRSVTEPRRWPARAGLALLGCGAVAMLTGVPVGLAERSGSPGEPPVYPILLIGGAVFAVLGVVLLLGRLVAGATRSAGRLPLVWRLAARDSARNRGRTVPAIAAVLAAATLAAAAVVVVASVMQSGKESYSWSANFNQAALNLANTVYSGSGDQGSARIDSLAPEDLAREIARSTPVPFRSWTLRGEQNALCWLGNPDQEPKGMDSAGCLKHTLVVPQSSRCPLDQYSRPTDRLDPRCRTGWRSSYPSILIGGPAELEALLGHQPSPDALQTLAGGGVVVSDELLQASGQAEIGVGDVRQQPAMGYGDLQRDQFRIDSSVRLPAVVEAPDHALMYSAFISEQTAVQLGLKVADNTLLVQFERSLSQAETAAVQAQITRAGPPTPYFAVETGFKDDSALQLWLVLALAALIILSAAGITAGLALADGRADQATLAGIGASPRIRKSLAAVQIAMTALIGSVLGILLGVLPAVLMILMVDRLTIVVPWLHLLALAVLVPILGAGIAWLITRSALPGERRQTLV